MIVVEERPYNYNWSGNAIHYKIHSTEAEADPNVYFEIMVCFSDSLTSGAQDFEQVVTFPYVPIKGIAKINIQEIIDSKLEFSMPEFAGDETTCYECKKQSGRFFIKYRQIIDADSDPDWEVGEVDFIRFAFKGGIAFFKYQSQNFWVNFFNIKRPFLTWQLSGRLAMLDERMYLCVMLTNIPEVGNMKRKMRVIYTDGSDNIQFKNIDIQTNRPWLVPCGAIQWGLPALDVVKKIWYWEFSLVDVTNPDAPVQMTEIFKFFADNRNDYNKIILYYRNSLGGLDSIRVRGPVDTNIDYTTIQKDGVFESNYYAQTVIGAPSGVADNQEIISYKGDIGWLGKEEQSRLRDAFLRREVYQTVNKKWIPILLVQKAFKQRNSNDKIWSMPIEWKPAIAGDRYYTPDSVDFGNDQIADIPNTCPIVITDWTYNWTFAPGFPGYARVTNSFQYTSDPAQIPANLQYRIQGYTDWVDFPTTNEFEVRVRMDNETIMQIRAKCANGEYGQIASKTFILRDDSPQTHNSRLINNSTNQCVVVVKVNGAEITRAAMGGRGTFDFDTTNVNSATINVEFHNARPTSISLVSNSVRYSAHAGAITADGATFPFAHVNIINGMTITFQ